MKKFLSVFLAVLMLVGMLPMTAIHTHAATAKYVKVTENLTDWSGRYLIVYESGKKAMNGGLALSKIDADNNTINVTISNNAIEATTAVTAAEFTITSVGSGSYTIKSSKNGYYIGRTGSSNGMDENATTAHKHTIKYSSGNVVITSSGGPTLQAYQSGSTYRFRYYKTTQKAIALYKLEEATACAHANTTTTTVDATCTEDGSKTVTCNDCGEIVSTETIDALGHEYVLSGTTYTCSGCGDSYEIFKISFSVPEGVDPIEDMEYSNSGITLPTPTGTPSGDYEYTFAGWTSAEVDNETAKPTIYEAGTTFTANAATTLYALYTYTVADEGTASSEYVLKNISEISDTDEVVITMTYTDGTVYALSSANGSSKAPIAQIVTVKNGKLEAEPADALMWNIGGSASGYIFYPAGQTAKWLYTTNTNDGVRVGTNTNKTFIIDASSGYLKNTATNRYVGVYRTNPDWRCYTNTTGNTANQTLGFYVKSSAPASQTYYTTVITVSECTHEWDQGTQTTAPTCENTGVMTYTCTICKETKTEEIAALGHTEGNPVKENNKDATCTEDGSYDTVVYCSVCNKELSRVTTTVEATGHSYVDGSCDVCGKTQPEATSTRYYIAAKRTAVGSKLYYMTNELTTTSTKRYAAEATELTEVPEIIENPKANKIFVLVNDGDGNYTIYAEGLDADANYLGWTSGNSGALVTEDEAKILDVAFNDDGSVRITFNSRNLTLNNNTGNDYFAWYESEQANVYLIPIKEGCKHTSTTTTTVDATCTVDGSVTVTCDNCGETIRAEVIEAQGHSYSAEVVEENGIPAVVNTCACGDEQKSELKFTTASLTLQNNIVVNFKTTDNVFGNGVMEGFTDLRAEFTYGNRVGEKMIVATSADIVKQTDGKYVVPCRQVTPSQIGDEITATLYGTYNGVEYSYVMKYSAAEYCYSTMVSKEATDDLKTLLVNLLYYCDAARAYTTYQGVDENYKYYGSVTEELTDEQKAYRTVSTQFQSVMGLSGEGDFTASWKSAALVLGESSAIQFRVDLGDNEDVTARVFVDDREYGRVQMEQITEGEYAGQYLILVSGLAAHQMRDTVEVTLYSGETAISKTVSYSMESYVYSKQNDSDQNLVAFLQAMISYGDAAVAYKKSINQ